MADKEPRRRKKRKDAHKKDDIRPEDQFFMSNKSETRDSDQEIEEEFVIPDHQPSNVAKVVFVLLFSGLVLSMSFVFISLKGAEKGPVDIFDGEHEDSHDLHESEESWSPESIQDSIEGILPDISSILSLNDEQVRTDAATIEYSELDAKKSAAEIELQNNDKVLQQDFIQESHGSSDSVTDYTEYAEESVTLGSIYSDAVSSEVPEEILEVVDNEEESHTTSYSSSFNVFTEIPEPKEESESVTESYAYTEESISDIDVELQTSSEQNLHDEVDSEFQDESSFSFYEKADITNDADYEIREQLDEVDKILEKSPERALKKCEELLHQHPRSPRLLYMKAQALDSLAEIRHSNKYLEDAIAVYQSVMSINNVPEELYILAGRRAADRLRFRGFMGKSLKLLVEMSDKFPQNIELKNQVAVGYLLIGQNKHARNVLLEVLKHSPDSGFAKVHLGFIMKTDDSNYSEAIKLMSEGIESREPGVIDGRFYFHLGDALHREGKQEQALKVYEDAVKEGLFMSVYQRSLYNVKELTGKPWWDPLSTPYASYFKVLEANWLLIRNEALSLISEKNSVFLPENEGLQDKGDWKQLELFARGIKNEKNCLKVPKTCALISHIPDAASCKRGQVKFSIMHPATHVWAHTGPTNCRLRSHLGLVVPEGASIRVANETRKWEEGKIILFDDSFEHEVWHNGSSLRLVLIVDFWHPELTAYQKKTLTPI